MPKHFLWLIVGPSATGKTTLLRKFQADPRYQVQEPCSYTNRDPRPGEVPGTTYHYVTDETYDRMLENREFVEHLSYVGSGMKYGLTRADMDHLLSESDVMVVVTGVGADQLKQAYPEQTRVIFLLPPAPDILRQRMRERGESEDQIEKRLASIQRELDWLGMADLIVYPTTPEETFQRTCQFVDKEKSHELAPQP